MTTLTGTRCCEATSVHWIGCRQKLDVNDPRSFITVEALHDTHGSGPGERPDDCAECLREAEAEASR